MNLQYNINLLLLTGVSTFCLPSHNCKYGHEDFSGDLDVNEIILTWICLK